MRKLTCALPARYVREPAGEVRWGAGAEEPQGEGSRGWMPAKSAEAWVFAAGGSSERVRR